MNVMGYDTETTGKDIDKDRIIEAAFVVWNTDLNKPVYMRNELLFEDDYPEISKEAFNKHGITKTELATYHQRVLPFFVGMEEAFRAFNCKALVAHNGLLFDRPMTLNQLGHYEALEFCSPASEVPNRNFKFASFPLIDTLIDIEYPDTVDGKKLNQLAYHHEFLNPFKHRALFDTLTMLRVLSNYKIEDVVERRNLRVRESHKTKYVVESLTHYLDRQLSKDAGFKYQEHYSYPGLYYEKTWFKVMSISEIQDSTFPFKMKVIEKYVPPAWTLEHTYI